MIARAWNRGAALSCEYYTTGFDHAIPIILAQPGTETHLAQYLILGDSNPISEDNVTIPDKVAAQRQLEMIGVGFSPFMTAQYRLAGTMTTSEDYPFTQLFQGRLYIQSGISAENFRWTEISLTLSFVSR